MMKNPWLAKNPYLSVWLSAANTMVGMARGYARQEARRQQRSLADQTARAMTAFWAARLSPPPKKRRRKA